MEQKNSIKLSLDIRNNSYILLFLLIDWSEGKKVETELRRMVFPNREEVVRFKKAFLQAFEQQGI